MKQRLTVILVGGWIPSRKTAVCGTCSPMTFRTHRSLPRSMDSAIRFGKIININLKEQRQRGGKEREAERKEVNDRALWLCFRGWMAMRVWRNGGGKGERGVDNLRERAGQPTVRYGDGAEQRRRCWGSTNESDIKPRRDCQHWY